MTDIYDGTEWTDMEIEDLKAAIAHGRSTGSREFLVRYRGGPEVISARAD
jgi:hypothetical protein